MPADEIELSKRAYDLAMGIRDQFNAIHPAPPIQPALPNSFDRQLAIQLRQRGLSPGQIAAFVPPPYMVSPPPTPPDPLETAIQDVDVSIYEVIKLAEERA